MGTGLSAVISEGAVGAVCSAGGTREESTPVEECGVVVRSGVVVEVVVWMNLREMLLDLFAFDKGIRVVRVTGWSSATV